MRIGIHKVHNRFPYILRYLWPRLLNGITRGINDVKIYKWLWWFIELPGRWAVVVTGCSEHKIALKAAVENCNSAQHAQPEMPPLAEVESHIQKIFRDRGMVDIGSALFAIRETHDYIGRHIRRVR